MQPLPGFRDFYPDDCARRNYIVATWREVARRYGFVEYDGPTAEPLALYEKKSGGELVGQLFTVATRAEEGAAKGALRPEMTPTLARMVAARERDFKKPLKWFCVSNFFRHERQQRGRLREFYQFNADIIGETALAADAELIALIVELMRLLGFSKTDFVIRVSDRNAWHSFFQEQGGGDETRFSEFLQIIDKMEREGEATTETNLQRFNTSLAAVRDFIGKARATWFADLAAQLEMRGAGDFVEFDLTIVRGLAYYTGVVFEVFDRSKKERALAGGGRYDKLLSLMSDGKVDLPALGFGMGDVVLANLIDDTPAAKAKMDAWIAQHHACEIYVVIAKEQRRAEALGIVQQLRDAGRRVDFPLTEAKVGKQFQTAEHLGARLAILIGDEWPEVKVKRLATREETLVNHHEVLQAITG